MEKQHENGELKLPETCFRCGNQLALGLGILEAVNILGAKRYTICGACFDEFFHWLKVYEKRMERRSES